MDERTPEIERPGPDEPMSLTPPPRASATSVRVAAVAGSQWGVINLRQLNACGVSGTMVSRWVAEGRLHRLHRGVYAVGHRAVPIEGRLTAALFFAGAGAALSHATAAWWWWLVEEEPAAIHISVPHRRHPTGGVELHHPRRLDRVWHRRLPVTTVSRTLLDLAAGAPTRRLRRALAQADFHRRLELDAVDDVLRRGHAGSQALRQALARHRPQLALARSELEERFLTLCESGALPIPELNAKLHGLMVDVLWREQRVVVELDGRAAHGTPAQIERDHERDMRLRTAGFIVLRYTWRQVVQRSTEVLRGPRRNAGAAWNGAVSQSGGRYPASN